MTNKRMILISVAAGMGMILLILMPLTAVIAGIVMFENYDISVHSCILFSGIGAWILSLASVSFGVALTDYYADKLAKGAAQSHMDTFERTDPTAYDLVDANSLGMKICYNPELLHPWELRDQNTDEIHSAYPTYSGMQLALRDAIHDKHYPPSPTAVAKAMNEADSA